MQKTQKNIFSLFAIFLTMAIFTTAQANTFNPRFSRTLEYQLMDFCVGDTIDREKKMRICSCALARTQEDGYAPDYDHDGDYREDEEGFLKKFGENIALYKRDVSRCKGR